jgi:CO/xanthine dehydrogenase FAD-binding subunit
MEFISTRDSLNKINQSGKSYLFTGMDVSLEQIFENLELPSILHEALEDGISWHVRAEMSVERSILSPGSTYPWVAMLMALGAEVIYTDGIRKDIADYMKQRTTSGGAPFGILIPLDLMQLKICYQAVRPTPANLPTVSVCTVLEVDQQIIKNAKIALTGTFRNQLGLAKCAENMIGKRFDSKLVQDTIGELLGELKPVSNFHASAEYRMEMAKCLTERALYTCMQEAVS